jgi:hypothetical protein
MRECARMSRGESHRVIRLWKNPNALFARDAQRAIKIFDARWMPMRCARRAPRDLASGADFCQSPQFWRRFFSASEAILWSHYAPKNGPRKWSRMTITMRSNAS